MSQYEFFIDDERYAVVPRVTDVARSSESARHIAARLLAESSHRKKIMVYCDGVYLFAVTQDDRPIH